MQIREATEDDIPQIIEVLRKSLGEIQLPKTEKIWRFKHLENPFGKSLVLLAIEDNEIVGVRGFMRWKWMSNNIEYSALRAVDTGVLPKFQRRGIFNKLNAAGLNISKNRKDHFIFNTPNSKSLPGNLKMGWEKVDKLKIRLGVVNPFYWKWKESKINPKISYEVTDLELDSLILNYNLSKNCTGKLFTPKSRRYLTWRYENNPLQQYSIKATNQFYLAACVKVHKRFKELRVVECIYHTAEGRNAAKKEIIRWGENLGVQVISSHATKDLSSYVQINGRFGPVLTLRNLTLDEQNIQTMSIIENWEYMLGDMELF